MEEEVPRQSPGRGPWKDTEALLCVLTGSSHAWEVRWLQDGWPDLPRVIKRGLDMQLQKGGLKIN
jgi:hypothetical protein